MFIEKIERKSFNLAILKSQTKHKIHEKEVEIKKWENNMAMYKINNARMGNGIWGIRGMLYSGECRYKLQYIIYT